MSGEIWDRYKRCLDDVGAPSYGPFVPVPHAVLTETCNALRNAELNQFDPETQLKQLEAILRFFFGPFDVKSLLVQEPPTGTLPFWKDTQS